MQAAQHIDIDENDQNLDMLVGGMAGADAMAFGDGVEQPKKKKGKKKKKKTKTTIEVVDDIGAQPSAAEEQI